jgi:hypothetical protein
MSEHDREQLAGWAQALREELAQINPAHPWNRQRIADRQRGIELCQDQLARIERMHERFLMYRGELLARCDQFSRPGPH